MTDSELQQQDPTAAFLTMVMDRLQKVESENDGLRQRVIELETQQSLFRETLRFTTHLRLNGCPYLSDGTMLNWIIGQPVKINLWDDVICTYETSPLLKDYGDAFAMQGTFAVGYRTNGAHSKLTHYCFCGTFGKCTSVQKLVDEMSLQVPSELRGKTVSGFLMLNPWKLELVIYD